MTGSAIAIVLVSDHPANRGVAADAAAEAAALIQRTTGFTTAVLSVDAHDLEPAVVVELKQLVDALAAGTTIADAIVAAALDPVVTPEAQAEADARAAADHAAWQQAQDEQAAADAQAALAASNQSAPTPTEPANPPADISATPIPVGVPEPQPTNTDGSVIPAPSATPPLVADASQPEGVSVEEVVKLHDEAVAAEVAAAAAEQAEVDALVAHHEQVAAADAVAAQVDPAATNPS